MTNTELAAAIVQTVEAANILGATNCMTRLRLHLARRDQSMLDKLKALDGVLGLNIDGDELQIILGPGRATNVTNEVKALLSKTSPAIGDGKALRAELKEKNATPIKLFFKKIAGIFIPLIPGFIACGLITGCVGLAIKIDPMLVDEPLIKLLMVAGNTVFWGMNLFVGYNAAKVFDGTPILGGILAALITHPALSDVVLSGGALVPGRGGVISVVLVAWLGAYVEKKLHAVVPEMFDLFVTPLLTFLTAGSAAIFLLQPLGGVISETIGIAATS
ncbi:MAG: PTS transporter subunit EIIC, partial [Selenomonadaceae bacterium]|nr:PTS transporter subunit EIIC [Selenomonadaceae bacterium]